LKKLERNFLTLRRRDVFVVGVVTGTAVVDVTVHSTCVGFSRQLIQVGSNGATLQVTAVTSEGSQYKMATKTKRNLAHLILALIF